MKHTNICKKHPEVSPVVFCPACRGSVTSPRKAAASRENGKLGGRHKSKKTNGKANYGR